MPVFNFHNIDLVNKKLAIRLQIEIKIKIQKKNSNNPNAIKTDRYRIVPINNTNNTKAIFTAQSGGQSHQQHDREVHTSCLREYE